MIDEVWHDLECGTYLEDLPVWRNLARRHGEPILDVGAGAGRVALDLARREHAVTALDFDAGLLAELRRRADGVEVRTVVADARQFILPTRFALVIVPMQMIQLLGGSLGRAAFLRCARQHLKPGGVVAVALAERLECFDIARQGPAPPADVLTRAGVTYRSQPTAVRRDGEGFALERRRETITPGPTREVTLDVVHLDSLSAVQLEQEAAGLGLRRVGRVMIAPTTDHVGSAVVVLGV